MVWSPYKIEIDIISIKMLWVTIKTAFLENNIQVAETCSWLPLSQQEA